MTTPDSAGDDFEVGKVIFEKLKDLPPDRQERVLRWVSEGLGISKTGTPAPPSGENKDSIVLPPGGEKHVDIKTFVAKKSPRSDMQFAAVVAYYYRFEAPPALRRETINSDVLREATRHSGRHRVEQPINTLRNAKNQGYLDSAVRGEYSLNSVGENLVAMTLPGDALPTSTAKTKAPSRKRNGSRKRTR